MIANRFELSSFGPAKWVYVVSTTVLMNHVIKYFKECHLYNVVFQTVTYLVPFSR